MENTSTQHTTPCNKLQKNHLADWIFSTAFTKSGKIDDGSLTLKDTSGNGNDLELITNSEQGWVPPTPYIQWSADGNYMNFHNSKREKIGQYFQTVAEAPINEATFPSGYTIEVMMKLPQDFSPDQHSWMGILTRQGHAATIGKMDGEHETLSTLSVSSLREIQWSSHPTNLQANDTNWSFTLDSTDDWYHIAIVNDGSHTTLYINGVTDFRNAEEEMLGIDYVPGKGWNIGASEWGSEIDTLFAGSIQRIRITGAPLSKEHWFATIQKEGFVENGTNESIPLLTKQHNYNFLFIPDPQKTVRYMPELFQKQVEWITEYEQQLNLAFTTFLGDMVDQSDAEEEWHNSSSIIQLLDDSNTAYVTIAGNHDYGDKDPYLDYYSPERFSHKPYYKGASASGYSSYSIVSAGSYEYMILAIDMQHLKVDSKWAEQILAQHPTLPTILVSHEILDISGDGVSPIETWRGKWLWNNLISNNNQIFLTVSGHNHGAAYQIKQNANGQAVIQILVDYQSSYHGGNGWMRFTEFDEINNQIICKTYSPWVDQLPISERTYFDVAYLTGEGDHFTIPFPFKERFDFSSTC